MGAVGDDALWHIFPLLLDGGRFVMECGLWRVS